MSEKRKTTFRRTLKPEEADKLEELLHQLRGTLPELGHRRPIANRINLSVTIPERDEIKLLYDHLVETRWDGVDP